MKKIFSRELKIGLLVVIAAFLLYFGINFLKGIDIFQPASYFYAKYDRVDGIVKTSSVYINGYKVGHVSDIFFDYSEESPIVLEITVDEKLVVPKGTVAELYDTSLMGEKAVQLILGDPRAGILVAGDTLQGGIDGGMMADIVAAVVPSFEKLIPELDSTIQAFRKIAEDDNIRKILANTEGVTGGLNKFMNEDLQKIVTEIDTITTNFAKISKDLNEADLKQTIASLDSSLANIEVASAQLKSKDNSLGLLLNDKSLYNGLDSTINNANKLVIDLKENPSRYVHFSVFGKKEKKAKK